MTTASKRMGARGGHLSPAERNARIRAANRIKELLAANNIQHHDAERMFDISNWMMSKIRVNPEAVAFNRLMQIHDQIKAHVEGKTRAEIPLPRVDTPLPLSESDFEPVPPPKPRPKLGPNADPVTMLIEAIEVHRRCGMTPMELLETLNSMNRIAKA